MCSRHASDKDVVCRAHQQEREDEEEASWEYEQEEVPEHQQQKDHGVPHHCVVDPPGRIKRSIRFRLTNRNEFLEQVIDHNGLAMR